MKSPRQLIAYLIVTMLAVGALALLPASTNAPSVERLRAHIKYLASDKLEGRRSSTAGATLAAEYCA